MVLSGLNGHVSFEHVGLTRILLALLGSIEVANQLPLPLVVPPLL